MKEEKYRMTYGRKFFAGLFGTIIILYVYTITLFMHEEAITSRVTIATIYTIVVIVVIYIGGNVLNKFIRSKFFHIDLYNGEEK